MRDTERLFKALADEERLRIISLLLFHRDGACVCELVDALRIPQYQVSRQLAVLREAGLVTGDKSGTWVYYRISHDLTPLAGAVAESLAAHLGAGEERERFASRLRLRDQGLCTIGYPDKTPYREAIPVVER